MNSSQKESSRAVRRGKIEILSLGRLLLVSLFLGILPSTHAEWCVTVTDAAAARRVGSQKCGFATQAAAEAFGSGIGISRSFYKITGSDDTSSSNTSVTPAASGREMAQPIANALDAGLSGRISGGDAAGLIGAGIVAQGFLNMLNGNKGNDAAAAAQAAQQAAIAAQQSAERQRQAEAEAMQRQELAKQRILGALKGVESSGNLGLKTDSDQPLIVERVQSGFGSTMIVPVGLGDALSVGGLLLKLGDDPDQSGVQAGRSANAGKGFDVAGNFDLPAPPPTPTAKMIPIKLDKMNTFRADLKKNEDETKALTALLERLKQSPTPDDAAIKDAEKIITAKEEDKKKIEKKLLDLTAEDDVAGTTTDKPAQP